MAKSFVATLNREVVMGEPARRPSQAHLARIVKGRVPIDFRHHISRVFLGQSAILRSISVATRPDSLSGPSSGNVYFAVSKRDACANHQERAIIIGSDAVP